MTHPWRSVILTPKQRAARREWLQRSQEREQHLQSVADESMSSPRVNLLYEYKLITTEDEE